MFGRPSWARILISCRLLHQPLQGAGFVGVIKSSPAGQGGGAQGSLGSLRPAARRLKTQTREFLEKRRLLITSNTHSHGEYHAQG